MGRAFPVVKSVQNFTCQLNAEASSALKTLIDLGLLTLALWLAFLLRYEGALPPETAGSVMFFWALTVPLQYGLCALLQVTHCPWRYSGLREALCFTVALAAGAGVLLCLRAGVCLLDLEREVPLLPVGVILIDFALAVLFTTGARGLSRTSLEHTARVHCENGAQKRARALLLGAGQAGWMVAREIATDENLSLHAVGFLDDDSRKKGAYIYGLPVLGTLDQLPEIAKREHAAVVILTIARAPGQLVRRVSELAKKANVTVKLVPGIAEIVSGHVSVSRIRNVSIEDLLRREPVVFEDNSVRDNLSGKTVMVTGAGGSIGSELCRQICRFGPRKLVLIEQSENPLFYISRELQSHFPDVPLELCIADICDGVRMETLFEAHRPEAIFHAAAHKHVPMMEANPGEAIKNNVLGTKMMADLAHRHAVNQFVMISTDKAINPTSVMGVSKRVAEVYIQALSQRSPCRFVTVRFGNVLGSSGSVVPIFQTQIAQGGPVTITHPEMRRYFMTIPEASQLVLQAASLGHGGEIFILDMGEPVKIVDLARDLIRLSGLRPGEDVEIRFTGTRPGEKLFEELSVSEEQTTKTRHPRIFVGQYRRYPWKSIQRWIERLRQSSGLDAATIRETFREIIPEYTPDNGKAAPLGPPAKPAISLQAAPPAQQAHAK